MSFPITYTPEGLAYGDQPRFISATDGDTPTIQLPIRMLGMDAPELHFVGASENNPGKYDADLRTLLNGAGQGLPEGLRNYLAPKLQGNPCTRHIQEGRASFDHFQSAVTERLAKFGVNGQPITPRRLFTKASKEVFDHYGRLLAYVAPSYTREERETIPEKDRPSFNLQMMQDGH